MANAMSDMYRDLSALVKDVELSTPEHLAEARRQVEEVRAVLTRMAQRRIQRDCEEALRVIERKP